MDALADYLTAPLPPRPKRPVDRPTLSIQRLLAVAGLGAVVAALPFVVFVRSAVTLHLDRGLPAWLAIASAVGITASLVTAYAAWASFRISGRLRLRVAFKWVAVPLVLLYAGSSLASLSAANAKTDEIRATYRRLHPVLRAAVGTLLLFDREVVLTDLARAPEQYDAMGLPAAAGSAHFRQSDRYVHAVDLRTLGRPAWRNWIVERYFRIMGFRTLRHTGTADHLHVALPVR